MATLIAPPPPESSSSTTTARCVAALTPERQAELQKDLKTLALFIHLYCRTKHAASDKTLTDLKGFDVQSIAGRPVILCEGCTKLLAHAFVKRSNCPFDPKPMCKHCPTHCYHPNYRAQIREVMRVSGRKLLLSGRLDYLFHLLF